MLVAYGLICFLFGIGAYRGYIRWWAESFGYVLYWGFSLLYLGIIVLTAVFVANVGDEIQPLRAVIRHLLTVACGVVLVSIFWMPNFLLPSWFKDGRARSSGRVCRTGEPSGGVLSGVRREGGNESESGMVTVGREGEGSWRSLNTVSTEDMVITYPAALCELDSSGTNFDCIIAARQIYDGVFRPNIVFSSESTEDALVDCVLREQNTLQEQFSNASLLMMSPHARIGKDAESMELIGFVTISWYSLGESAVIVKRWDYSTGTRHLCITASFTPSQMAFVEPAFDWIIRNIEFSVSLSDLSAAMERWPQTPEYLDQEASERFRFPVPNLSLFRRLALQALPYDTRQTLEARLKDLGADLRGAHLLDVVVTTRGWQGSYRVLRGSRGPVVVRTAPATADDWLSMSSQDPQYAAYRCSPDMIFSDLLAWIDPVPNYAFKDEMTLPVSELQQRLAETDPERAWKRFEFSTDGTVQNWFAIPGKDAFYDTVLPDSSGTVELWSIPHFHIISTVAEAIGKVSSATREGK